MAEPTSLAALLSRLEPLIVDDAAAAEIERGIADTQRLDARIKRQEVLHREQVALAPDVEAALLDGGDALQSTRALRAVRRWLTRDDVPSVLVLSGGTGTGKTVAAAHALLERRGGIWRTAAQLCRTFAASFGDQVDDQDLCLRASMLVADDVGAELDPARMAATLVELLEHRKRSARYMRTVITTNLNRAAFEKRYREPRLHSRMADSAKVVAWVETRDADMRRSSNP